MIATKNEETNILYFQSGGPTAVINSSFMGLYKEYLKHSGMGKLYVSPYGIGGLLKNELHEVKKGEIPILKFRPGAYWGSLREKLPEDPNDPLAVTLIQNLLAHHIRYVFPNGGNDSMDTAHKIALYAKAQHADIQTVGIPKTIDNDLPFTDHTPGFGSAAKYVANSVIAISLDDKSYEKGKINIVEVMGRDAGFLTASSYLASLRGQTPDFIYVPEAAFDTKAFVEKAKRCYDEKGRCLVVVSEGIRDKEGKLISALERKDSFGNIQMGGVSYYLSSLVSQEGYKSRAIELNVVQRASSFLPSGTDIKEAEMCGKMALRFARSGKSDVMVCIERVHKENYAVKYKAASLAEIDGKTASLPLRYLNTTQDNIRPEYLSYVEPLIQGNELPMDKDGLLKLY